MSKKNNIKVGVVNCFQIKNYGSVLQSYATQKIVQDLGYEVESIYYNKNKSFKQIISYLPQLVLPSVIKMKYKNIKKSMYIRTKGKNLKNSFEIRDDKFNEFVDKNFIKSPHFIGYESLKKNYKRYDIVLLGSDQVWHPINLGSHYYTLEWVGKETKKVTYSASFGVSQIPSIQKNSTRKYLSKIDNISVRETAGKKIVKDMVGKSVPVVVDPTMLFSAEKWDEVCSEKQFIDEDYIFCYYLGENEQHRKAAEELSEKTGCKIVTLPFMDEIVERDFRFGDIVRYDVGPAEFLNLIKNAKYVCTDSFHGTVYSAIYRKQFIVFNRYSEISKGSTNSRIHTLLDSLNLSNRKYNKKVDILTQMENRINYDSVNKRIDELRYNSMKYLVKSLKM